MIDYILIDGDQVLFLPMFGAAIVTVLPGILQATGKAKLAGKKICLLGDESRVSVNGCAYMTPDYPIPGIGTLKIDKLTDAHQSKLSQDSNKAILLKAGQFQAKFIVNAPAMQPVPPPGTPIPDPNPDYMGKGQFLSVNTKLTSS